MSFSDDVKNACANLNLQIGENVKKASFELLGKIQVKSPVDSGALKQSWVISQNSDGYVISTNKPYAMKLEYGLYSQGAYKTDRTINGFSSQAPKGFIRLSLIEIATKYRGTWS